jgi:hypothetical protein
MRGSWLNPAGGLRYHTRALLGERAWAPFRATLATWLAEFRPKVERALLVGPSAGYGFPDEFLQRFSSLTVLEPDPIAGFLLRRRLQRLGVRDVRIEPRDLLIAPLLSGGEGLPELLAADPDASLVFGNVLGQTRFLCSEAEFPNFKAAFRQRIAPLLAGRAWLSFHDRLSGSLSPRFDAPYISPARLDDVGVLRELYPSELGGPLVELFDHQSDGFFPSELPHAYFNWHIGRARYHLIEGVALSRA